MPILRQNTPYVPEIPVDNLRVRISRRARRIVAKTPFNRARPITSLHILGLSVYRHHVELIKIIHRRDSRLRYFQDKIGDGTEENLSSDDWEEMIEHEKAYTHRWLQLRIAKLAYAKRLAWIENNIGRLSVSSFNQTGADSSGPE